LSAAGRHARPGRRWYLLPLPLAALAAMVMPVRAVRRLREQQRDISLCIRTIAYLATREPSR
jgi:hypothetical protein